jgi:hypothetical protein
MAAGALSLYGKFDTNQFRQLMDTARRLGVERELEIAWKRGVADCRILLVDQAGVRVPPKPTWPPI